jgi:hypothetical protein
LTKTGVGHRGSARADRASSLRANVTPTPAD